MGAPFIAKFPNNNITDSNIKVSTNSTIILPTVPNPSVVSLKLSLNEV